MDSSQINHEAVMMESSLFLEQDTTAPSKHSGIKKDLKHIIFLIYLYLLQGVPLGLAASIPFLLAIRKVSYGDQGTFTFAFYPFSIKLLWAPIVDSLFIKKLGRRKSWLIPVQLLIGIFMLVSASYAQSLVYNQQSKADIIVLTMIFTVFTFLAATQDIALDGWAISMLSKENVTWQSTCNGVGQTAGFFIGNISIIVFESPKFCNNYIRPLFNLADQDYGIVSLEKFMYGFGFVFLATSFVVLLKKEIQEEENESGIVKAYINIKKLLSLRSIQKVALIFLTVKIGMAAENISNLKLIEKGVSKEKLSLLSIPIVPFSIISTIVISKFIKKRPLKLYLHVLPVRLLFSLLVALIVYLTPQFREENGEYKSKFYLILFSMSAIQTLIETTMFICQMAFFASISDTAIGGTYMTLLATLSNLGSTYPGTIALYLLNLLSKKRCLIENQISDYNSTQSVNYTSLFQENNSTFAPIINKCSTSKQIKQCKNMDGECINDFDAFYLLVGVFFLIGVAWFLCFRKLFTNLSKLPKSEWKIK